MSACDRSANDLKTFTSKRSPLAAGIGGIGRCLPAKRHLGQTADPYDDLVDLDRLWDRSLKAPGAVEIAVSGQWEDKQFGLKGGPGPDFNHAKIGVSISGLHNYSIFGDMNQQGSLSGPNCGSSQNGRGGLFYVIDNQTLSGSIMTLLNGDTAAEGVAHKNSKVSPIKDLKSALLQTFDRGCQINDHQIRLYIGYAFRSRQQRVDEFVWKLRLRRSHSTKRCPQ
jgi:hypothetical protein